MTTRPISDEQLWGSPPSALKLPPGMVWRAHDVLGVGHLLPHTPLPNPRYLCGRLPVAERFAWPVKSRCEWCVKTLEEGRV